MYSLPTVKNAGDVIRSADFNALIMALENTLGYTHVENVALPIQVSKPSFLLLMLEGIASPDFPNVATVEESEDGTLYEEVASVTWLFVDISEVKYLLVPVPMNYFVSWSAPYGFLQSAILF